MILIPTQHIDAGCRNQIYIHTSMQTFTLPPPCRPLTKRNWPDATTSHTPNAKLDHYKYACMSLFCILLSLLLRKASRPKPVQEQFISISKTIICDRELSRSHECRWQLTRPSPPLSKIEPERHLNPSADQQEPANLSTPYKDREYK